MDFFQSQDAARVRTRWLVLMFCVAVVLMLLTIYLVVVGIIRWNFVDEARMMTGSRFGWWQPMILLWTSALTLAVIGGGSLYKIAALSEGGDAVARLLGGRPVDPDTDDPAERRLLNVVEEMAIASGVSVPQVYVLDREDAINAFAAGFRPENAVIGVTRGCVRLLDRDELQGVIAHEFSHILNGDMRLNLRLIGVLHGILLLAIIGYWILRSQAPRGGRKGGGQIALLGLALLAVGGIGLFFGRLIKAAVSRQREYLADASAVQFTRYPQGIAGALAKIGGLSAGSKLSSSNVEQASHLLFGEGYRPFMAFLLSTHPPLEKRIRRIDPSWDGAWPRLEEGPEEAPIPPGPRPAETGRAHPAVAPLAQGEGSAEMEPEGFTARAGSLDLLHMEYVAGLIGSMPSAVTRAAHGASGAAALVLLLLVDDDPEVRAVQGQRLSGRVSRPVAEEMKRLWPQVRDLPTRARLPLLDLCLPALRTLSPAQAADLYEQVRGLVTADERVDVFEYVLQRVLRRRLSLNGDGAEEDAPRRGRLAGRGEACAAVLGALARAGHPEEDEARVAFEEGARALASELANLALPPAERCRLEDMDRGLRSLGDLTPARQRLLVEAAAATVLHDRRITVEEGELLRAVAASLGCPIPPLIPGMEIPQ